MVTRETRVRVARYGPVLAVALIAAVPAFYLLGERGFWGDEIWQVWWSQTTGWLDIFRRFSAPPDLPLPMLVTKLFQLPGQSEFATRLPSALAGIGSAVLTYVIAARQLGRWTGIAAALLVCFAPLNVWYEQEARPYASLEFLSLLSLATFLALCRNPGRLQTAAFIVANVLNIYNHLFGVFAIGVELVIGFALVGRQWLLQRRRTEPAHGRDPRRLAVALLAGAAAVAVLTLPLVPGIFGYVLGQEGGAPTPFIVDLDFMNRLFGSFGAGLGIAVIVLTLFAGLGAVAAVAGRGLIGPVALAWLALPLAALAVAQPVHHFIIRYFLFMLPIYLMLVAHGVITAGRFGAAILVRYVQRAQSLAPLSAAACVVLIVSAMLPADVGAQMLARGTDWSGMCRYMRSHVAEGDVIIGSSYFQGIGLWCFNGASGVAVPGVGRYTADDLYRTGRPSWYLLIAADPIDPALARLGYSEIPLADLETPGTHYIGTPAQFPYPIAEHGPSRLFHGPSVQPTSEVDFQEVEGKTIHAGWPNYTQVWGSGRYVVTLALQTAGPRYLQVAYLAGPGRIATVTANGIPVGQLGPSGPPDHWTDATIALPADPNPDVKLEFGSAGTQISAISYVRLTAP